MTVTVDDGVRPETTAASLGKLKPAFSERGTTTAGNSSQVTGEWTRGVMRCWGGGRRCSAKLLGSTLVHASWLRTLPPPPQRRHTSHPVPPRPTADGAAAVMLMRRAEAVRRGLPILGVFRTAAVVGVDPAVMGIGPAVAIPAAVQKAGLQVRRRMVWGRRSTGASTADARCTRVCWYCEHTRLCVCI